MTDSRTTWGITRKDQPMGLGLLLCAVLSLAGCSAIVGGKLGSGPGDAGDGGIDGRVDSAVDAAPRVACIVDQDCVVSPMNVAGTLACRGACRMLRCDFAALSPDGTSCGSTVPEVMTGTRICVREACVTRMCGDGYVDRSLAIPEFCDDGRLMGGTRTSGCGVDLGGEALCTRPCGVWASAPVGYGATTSFPGDCGNDGNPCNGDEVCADMPEMGADGRVCLVRDVPAEDSPCGDAGETCQDFRCVDG